MTTTNDVRTSSLPSIALLGVASLLVLGACGGTKAALATAINEGLAKQKVCFAHAHMGQSPVWPLRVRRQAELLSEAPLNPVLAAMQTAGQVRVTQMQDQSGFMSQTVDVIAPTEEAKAWWDNNSGWCVGIKAVAEIGEWTPPDGAMLEVKYTWKLIDVPSWARKDAFSGIKGMKEPIADAAVVQRTNKGWTVAF